ncbi:hypothetical protein LK495_15425, partial [Eggerthella lenta]|uniref:hypothetical protein n=1 Tax=Eggerthella lenta TaxID=84112 RepID=UPI001D0FA3DE
SAAGPLEDTVPASPLPDGPWLDAGLPDCPPDWTDATWLSSNGAITTGFAYTAVLISRAQLVHIHKNDFHCFDRIWLPLLSHISSEKQN